AVWRAPVRPVAIATGRTWGAGADLFAACDERVAAPDASFRFPGAAFGVVLGTRRLAERVGTDRARAWASTGATLVATAAAAAGLASRVAPAPPESDTALGAWRREALADAPAIDRETLAAIRAASRPAGGPGADALADADLAALVRSASRPGLKARILDYRERSRAASPRPA
ncbi:MAG: enoyl-CoA hydratase-related protein, partial [Burkholderiales bacterium]